MPTRKTTGCLDRHPFDPPCNDSTPDASNRVWASLHLGSKVRGDMELTALV